MAKKQKPVKKPAPIKPDGDPPKCPPGYEWDNVLAKCVLSSGD